MITQSTQFAKFHGKSQRSLESFVRKIYPLADLHTGGDGEIYFTTGMYVQGDWNCGPLEVQIWTGLYFTETSKLRSVYADGERDA